MTTPPRHDPATAGQTEADQVSAAVLACPQVAGLSAGVFGEVRSYLPGRSVPGVRLGEATVEVHVVAHYGTPLPAVASQIATAVASLLGGRELRVVIEDIALPGQAGTPPGRGR